MGFIEIFQSDGSDNTEVALMVTFLLMVTHPH